MEAGPCPSPHSQNFFQLSLVFARGFLWKSPCKTAQGGGSCSGYGVTHVPVPAHCSVPGGLSLQSGLFPSQNQASSCLMSTFALEQKRLGGGSSVGSRGIKADIVGMSNRCSERILPASGLRLLEAHRPGKGLFCAHFRNLPSSSLQGAGRAWGGSSWRGGGSHQPPDGAPCGGLMGCYHSEAETGAFSLQIPKYLVLFSSGARILQSCCFLWLRCCHPDRAARCPCSADASLCVLIPDAQGPSRAAGGRVNIWTDMGTYGPEMPRAPWCRGEALPGDAHAARWGWMPTPCLVFKGNLEAAR